MRAVRPRSASVGPGSRHHLWLRLPDGTDEQALVSAALRAGVAVTPGRPYFCAEPSAGHLRLGYAAVAGPQEIADGVRRLRTACDEVLGDGALSRCAESGSGPVPPDPGRPPGPASPSPARR
ncbi:hypothetical protein AB0R12_21335, partial [Streptomyces niveus]